MSTNRHVSTDLRPRVRDVPVRERHADELVGCGEAKGRPAAPTRSSPAARRLSASRSSSAATPAASATEPVSGGGGRSAFAQSVRKPRSNAPARVGERPGPVCARPGQRPDLGPGAGGRLAEEIVPHRGHLTGGVGGGGPEADTVVGDCKAVGVFALNVRVVLAQGEARRGTLDLDFNPAIIRRAAGLFDGMYRAAHRLEQWHQAVQGAGRRCERAGEVGASASNADCLTKSANGTRKCGARRRGCRRTSRICPHLRYANQNHA